MVSWNIVLIYNNNIPNFEVSSFALTFLAFLQTLQYSFFQQDQNSLAMCQTLRQCFLLYISGLVNSPGGGETTFDFMVRIFMGDKGCRLVGSWVRGLEFKMPSTSVITVNKDLSFRHSPCIFESYPRIALAERICRSQTPPIWLAKGRFLCHLIHSPPCSSRKKLNFPVIHLHIGFIQFLFSTNEITSIVWVDWSDISSLCNQPWKS